jgi:hypothetical protein
VKLKPNVANRSRIFIPDPADPTGHVGKTGLGGTPGAALKITKDIQGTLAVVSSSGAFTEEDATNSPGWYYYTLSAAECACSSRSQVGLQFLVTGLFASIGTPISGTEDLDIGDGCYHCGIAAAGAAQTITLSSAASGSDYYDGQRIDIYGGTGAGQSRRIVKYVGSTKVATVDRPWKTNPDNTSVYAVFADAQHLQEPLNAVAAGTLTATDFTTDLTATTADTYKDAFVRFVTGTLSGQVKKCTGYAVTGGHLTFTTGFTGAPAAGDLFAIVNG